MTGVQQGLTNSFLRRQRTSIGLSLFSRTYVFSIMLYLYLLYNVIYRNTREKKREREREKAKYFCRKIYGCVAIPDIRGMNKNKGLLHFFY